MIERLLLTLLIIGLSLAVYGLGRWLHLRRLEQATAPQAERPTLLYFASDACAACPTQARYLEQLAQSWHGRFHLQKIDADREPDKAAQYKVFTLPTTILLDAQGVARSINYGLTHSHKLAQQLETIGMQP